MAKENYWVVKVGVMKLWRGLCQAMDFAALEKGKTMAKEYIEREAAKARLRMWITDCVLDGDNEAADCFRDCIDLLDSIPAADFIEKKHGYWIKRIIENEKEDYPIRNVDYICSRCEGCWHEPLKYCPMCLAEMDKEETNELD